MPHLSSNRYDNEESHYQYAVSYTHLLSHRPVPHLSGHVYKALQCPSRNSAQYPPRYSHCLYQMCIRDRNKYRSVTAGQIKEAAQKTFVRENCEESTIFVLPILRKRPDINNEVNKYRSVTAGGGGRAARSHYCRRREGADGRHSRGAGVSRAGHTLSLIHI